MHQYKGSYSQPAYTDAKGGGLVWTSPYFTYTTCFFSNPSLFLFLPLQITGVLISP